MEQLIKKIEEKEKELTKLNSELNELGKKKYNYLIGKFFTLAASEKIKITGINYVDDTNVNVECLKIIGGQYTSGRIEFTINDDYYLRFIDIDEERIREITRDEFKAFLHECLSYSEKVALELIQ